jgi:hypothetical protein
MQTSITDWIQAGSSVLTMLAATAALIIASKAPRLAAKFAEEYRRQHAAQEEKQKLRLNVFLTLMRYRAELLAADARAAINLVDVAFDDQPEVRSARALFMEAAGQEPSVPTTIVERYHALIEAVARSLQLPIDGKDVRLGYYPRAAGRLDEAAIADAEEKIAKFESQQSKKKRLNGPNKAA